MREIQLKGSSPSATGFDDTAGEVATPKKSQIGFCFSFVNTRLNN